MKSLYQFYRCSVVLLSFIFITGCGGSDRKAGFSKLVVFGASLSDIGNVYQASFSTIPGPSPNYYEGRWSNGPLWIENVANSHNLPLTPSLRGGTDYAYGGAMTCTISGVSSTVPDMCLQVSAYLASNSFHADENALYVIDASAVGNEITKVLAQTVPSSQITVAAPINVIAMMQDLYNAGARRFLVTNVPDTGATPLIQSYGPTAAFTATNLSTSFNTALEIALRDFVASKYNAYVFQANFFEVFGKIKAAPSAYSMTDVNNPCAIGPIICTTPDSYLFWDDFHPTQAVGKLLASYILHLI